MGVRLTTAAYAHGLALALPESLNGAPDRNRTRANTYRMPIEGRDQWVPRRSGAIAGGSRGAGKATHGTAGNRQANASV